MNDARLSELLTNAVAFDTETHRIQPGLAAPPLVCGSFASWGAGQPRTILRDATATLDALTEILEGDATLAGANIAYDMLVVAVASARAGRDLLPLIFGAYAEGRIYDELIAEALHHIALGKLGLDPRTGRKLTDPESGKPGSYSLAIVHHLVTGESGAKANDRWRQSYALLEGIPIAQWPQDAIDYPQDDARNSLVDALAQAGLIQNVGGHDWSGAPPRCTRCRLPMTPGVSPECRSIWRRENLHDLSNQTRMAFAMGLGATWGLTPDPSSVARLKHHVTHAVAEDIKPFIAADIIRGDGTENQNTLKGLVARAYGAAAPCPTCQGTTEQLGRKGAKQTVAARGKIPSPKTAGRTLINCPDCDGTGLRLTNSCPRSDGGGIAKGRDQLAESGDELLMSYAAFGEDAKIRNVYIPAMEGAFAPELRLGDDELTEDGLASCLNRIAARPRGSGVIPITLRPSVLLETNRTSYFSTKPKADRPASGFPVQVLPREGGVRECFTARPGMVYYSNDYGGIELATWAQICLWMFGRSDLATALNNGVNVHGALAAEMCGKPYDVFMTAVKAEEPWAVLLRQAAKPGNFLFPGGGGELRLAMQAREQGPDTEHPSGPIARGEKRFYRGQRFCLQMDGATRCGEAMIEEYKGKPCAPVCKRCVACCLRVREGWNKRWSEGPEYLRAMNKIAERGYQVHPVSKRKRGGVGYNDGANGFFQELAAQGAKDGFWHVAREQYDSEYRPDDLGGERSPLFNRSRGIAFLHDEHFGEAIEDTAPENAERIGEVMVRRMKAYVPDVLVTAEPTLMRRWYKQAKCVRDANGRLMIWEPKK